jgi:uncharacterized protein involved in exopolysaccharide biosynthesis
MDTPLTFNLSIALTAWHASLPATLPPDTLAELESHLLDSMAELQPTGLSEEEAFGIACSRLGSLEDLAKEFQGKGAGGTEPHPATGMPMHAAQRPRRGWIRGMVVLGVLGLGAALLIPLWRVMIPKKYAASTLIQIRPQPDLTVGGAGAILETTFRAHLNEAGLADVESTILTSGVVLDKVVADLHLNDRWGTETPQMAAQRLKSMIETTWLPDAKSLRLMVTSTDKKEPAELANTIAAGYLDHSAKIDSQRYKAAHQFMTAARKQQEAHVEMARNEMLQLIQDFGIVEAPAADSAGGGAAPAGETTEGPVPPPATDQESPAAQRALELAKSNYQKAQADLLTLIDQQERTRVTHLPSRHGTILEPATEPPHPSSPTPDRWWYGAAVSGLLGAVSLGAAWTFRQREGRRPSIHRDRPAAVAASS